MTHRCLLWRCSETEDLLSDDSLPRSVPLCVCVCGNTTSEWKDELKHTQLEVSDLD